MPRTCSICNHPEKEAINMALIDNQAFRYVSKRFGVSAAALHRHKSEHLPAAMVKAREAAESTQADSLLDRLVDLNRTTMAILSEARQGNDNELALKAIQRAEKQLELQARLLGELNEAPTVNLLVANPEWVKVRTAILRALKPYPQAQSAVVLALEGVSHVSG
jgi:hypothetical protein